MKRLMLALALVSFTTLAHAEMRIVDHTGGRIGDNILVWEMVAYFRQPVVIDGRCMSACTLLLGIVPPSQVCATEKAVLGFHAAWKADDAGRAVTSSDGTKMLLSIYPPKIRAWIKRKGGLGEKMLYLQGRELLAHVRRCS